MFYLKNKDHFTGLIFNSRVLLPLAQIVWIRNIKNKQAVILPLGNILASNRLHHGCEDENKAGNLLEALEISSVL